MRIICIVKSEAGSGTWTKELSPIGVYLTKVGITKADVQKVDGIEGR